MMKAQNNPKLPRTAMAADACLDIAPQRDFWCHRIATDSNRTLQASVPCVQCGRTALWSSSWDTRRQSQSDCKAVCTSRGTCHRTVHSKHMGAHKFEVGSAPWMCRAPADSALLEERPCSHTPALVNRLLPLLANRISCQASSLKRGLRNTAFAKATRREGSAQYLCPGKARGLHVSSPSQSGFSKMAECKGGLHCNCR